MIWRPSWKLHLAICAPENLLKFIVISLCSNLPLWRLVGHYKCWTYNVYRVAIINCIWFKSLDFGYTWALLNTTFLFQLHRRSLLWSHCCWTELIHKAATVTFNHAHIARAINTRCRRMKTKRNSRKLPSSAQSAYITKWNLNRLKPNDPYSGRTSPLNL